MLKTLAKLEKTIGDKTYQFLLDADANILHAKEALLQFLGYVTQVEEAHKAQLAASQPESLVEQPKGEDGSVV